MKRIILLLASTVMVTLTGWLPASASSTGHLYANYGNVPCTQSYSLCPAEPRTILEGNSIALDNSRSTGLPDYTQVQVGTVSSSGSWPFTPGSGWNAKYDGHAVYQIQQDVNSLYNGTVEDCWDADQSNTTKIFAWKCNYGNNATLWVVSGGWWINVYATDSLQPGGPSTGAAWVMTAQTLNDNATVSDQQGGTYPASNQNWAWIPG